MNELFKSKWSTITAKGDKVVEIDIEGIIGFDWWDDDDSIIKSKEAMKSELKVISAIKATHINVNINSPGGDVSHGFSIHDLLASHEAHITTKVNGMTASAATVIAQAGDTRTMSDNALYLVHNAMTMAFGNKNDMQQAIDSLNKVDGRMENLYAKRSGESKESFSTLMASNNGVGEWITAEEAKTHGLIDEVFEPTAIAASVSFNTKKYGYPSYHNKLTNLKNSKMEKETKVENTDEKVLSVLDKFKALLTPKKEEKPVVTDEEIQAMADATKEQVEAAKTEKDTEFNAVKTDLDAQIEAKNKELEDLKAKNAKLEANGTVIESGDETLDKDKEVATASPLASWAFNKFQNRYGLKN